MPDVAGTSMATASRLETTYPDPLKTWQFIHFPANHTTRRSPGIMLE
jgi:hypothetical protein